MPPLLSLREIGKAFPSRKTNPVKYLFEGVNLDIEAGKTLGIMGKSGTGKTTLGKIIAGLSSPTSGEVRYLGKNIGTLGPNEYRLYRSRVQMMFQDPEGVLNPRKPISRLLGDCRSLTRLSTADHGDLVRKTLGQVGLSDDLLGYFPWQLSGGMNQRVALARILMVKPNVIVLDEPTSALDLSIQAQILRLLKTLQNQTGIGYLFISHDPEVVRWMSHETGLLTDGHLIINLNMAQKEFRLL